MPNNSLDAALINIRAMVVPEKKYMSTLYFLHPDGVVRDDFGDDPLRIEMARIH